MIVRELRTAEEALVEAVQAWLAKMQLRSPIEHSSVCRHGGGKQTQNVVNMSIYHVISMPSPPLPDPAAPTSLAPPARPQPQTLPPGPGFPVNGGTFFPAHASRDKKE